MSNTLFILNTFENYIVHNVSWGFPTLWGQNGLIKSKSVTIIITYLGTDLVTALAGLNVNDFPHDECLGFTITVRSVCGRNRSADWN